ncbi:CCA tRNA nucleotidyltransferase [Sphingomonas sp. JC676]|uniref:CCA tRNA nucleotidyltransferase n=1 Tax=Sphingomonas sp. JC676 TaxID=2768065 RepID=UPI0016585B1A|nr:CCA tRNA nucleotidyltransferase [Sphingomonas sp. JC676]MBC9031254.1 CCA tRNA nucleotidyltransferase [Sphingomonas sp. JC676]
MDGMILPNADWRHRDGLDRLGEVLGADKGLSRFVGGAVRDALLELPVADIDIATRHQPEDVIDLLRRAGIRAVPTGLAHGTITAVLESGPVEVTTLRRDVSTDGRRATVAFTDDWREDAARRDFTMNALYADPRTGELFDYFGGLADLEARRVRFIGDPLQRIAEDHLRILRFFRFLARFGDVPDPAGLEACTARAKDLMALSRERIADELLKLLVAKHAARVVRLMVDRGIFLPVLPEIAAEGVERLDGLATSESAAGETPDAIRRLAALLPPDPATADSVGARLKLSNAQRRRLITAVSPFPPGTPQALAYRLGTESGVDILLLGGRIEDAASVRDWPVPRIPLTGGALVERGLSKGPEVARALRTVEDRWIAEGFPDAARIEVIADEVVAQALRSVKS